MTMEQFRFSINAAIPRANVKHMYYSQTATTYYADFRPEYPEKSRADFLIAYEWLAERLTLIAETASAPIIEEFKNVEQMLDRLKNMELY